jgi:hypothetical protein
MGLVSGNPAEDALLALLDAIDQELRGVLWGGVEPFVSACETEDDLVQGWFLWVESGKRSCERLYSVKQAFSQEESQVKAIVSSIKRALSSGLERATQ